MRIALVGYGIEGVSAYHYWKKQGAEITVCDINPDAQVPDDVHKQLGPDYLKDLDTYDLVVRTAGLNPDIILAAHPGIADKITTIVDEFLRVCPTKNIIGITGTKGKGTTTTLIRKMLEAAGEQVFWGGNIGVPVLDFIEKVTPESWVVLELSSFQLIDVRRSPHISVCVMIVPEHLNWHKDMDEYILAKSHIFEYQTPQDIAIYYADNDLSRKIAGYSKGLKIPYYAEPGAHVEDNHIVIAGQSICQVTELKLLGKHNWQNVCAAVTAVWQVTQNVQAIRSVLTTFSGLEHRIEFVREVNDVRYYDDSFGTTPETAMVAMDAFEAPEVLILGGSSKGIPFDELAETIAQHKDKIQHVVLIGETAAEIEPALRSRGYEAITPGGKTMSEIVQTAHRIAQPGSVVLLSTASASFDMFPNYKERGDQFHAAVEAL